MRSIHSTGILLVVLILLGPNERLAAQGSDTIASIGAKYRDQAGVEAAKLAHDLTLASQPSKELFEIADQTENPEKFSTIVRILAERGLADVTILQRPFASGIRTEDESALRDEYRKWFSDDANVRVGGEGAEIFSDLASLLNGRSRWELIASTPEEPELVGLLSVLPDPQIQKVLTAWEERDARPGFWEKTAGNTVSLLVMSFLTVSPEAIVFPRAFPLRVRPIPPSRAIWGATSTGPSAFRFSAWDLPSTAISEVPRWFSFKNLPAELQNIELGQPKPGSHSFTLRDLNVLVIDDDASIVLASKLNLKCSGAKVDVGYSAADAVKMASEKPYDLIIMDYDMPGGTGASAMREIRKPGSLNETTPGICNSASDEPAMILDMYRSGFNALLEKPAGPRYAEVFLSYLKDQGYIPSPVVH
jgi:CheY-like chemotaxis protein